MVDEAFMIVVLVCLQLSELINPGSSLEKSAGVRGLVLVVGCRISSYFDD